MGKDFHYQSVTCTILTHFCCICMLIRQNLRVCIDKGSRITPPSIVLSPFSGVAIQVAEKLNGIIVGWIIALYFMLLAYNLQDLIIHLLTINCQTYNNRFSVCRCPYFFSFVLSRATILLECEKPPNYNRLFWSNVHVVHEYFSCTI